MAGCLYVPHFDANGNETGVTYIDPAAFAQQVQEIARAALAGAAVPVEAPHKRPNATHRWNVEATDDGVRICEGLHDKNEPCNWFHYVLKARAMWDSIAEPASGGHTMDEGPWTVIRDKVSGYGIGVGSDDFKRDVLLRVDGDFGCGVEKTDYCAWLARTLNQIGGRSHCPHCGQWHNIDAGC